MSKPITYDHWMTRHFILYSKGHYEKTGDVLGDLRTLLSNATGTPEEFYTDEAIYSFLSESFVDCCPRQDIKEAFKCFFRKPFFLGHGPATLQEMVEHMLGMMACIQVRSQDKRGRWYNLIDLGKPDPKYLPLRKEGYER